MRSPPNGLSQVRNKKSADWRDAGVLKNYIDYTESIADKNERERGRYNEDEETREGERKDIRWWGWRWGGEGEDRREKGQDEQGSDSGPVINEESNFQAGDLTSSRPTVAATQCELKHEKVVRGRGKRQGWGILQVDAQTGGGTAKEGWLDEVGNMAGD